MSQPPADNGNASAQTVTPTPPASQNANQAPSGDQEMASKLAATEQQLSEWRGRAETRAEEINRLKKAIVGEETTTPSAPQTVTSEDLTHMEDRMRWEIKHEQEIDLARPEYEKYIQKGYKREDALRLAHMDKGLIQNPSEHVRQQSHSSVPSGVDRSQGAPIEGINPRLYERLKAKGKTDDQIRELVKKAKTGLDQQIILGV